MIKDQIIYIRNFLSEGHSRTLLLKQNIVYSFLATGGLMAVNLLLVPATLNYVGTYSYGIWLTLSSLMLWVERLDLGLSNSLKNKLAAALAQGNMLAARVYVSTTYALLLLIAAVGFVLFLVLHPFINWDSLLKTEVLHNPSLLSAIIILFFFFFVQLAAQIINVVLTASHEPAKVTFITLGSSLTSLIILFGLTQLGKGSLVNLVFILGGTPLLFLVLASCWYYNKKYAPVAPHISFVNLSYAGQLFGAGWYFFIIQLGHLIIYNTHNLVIAQLFGPEEVTQFHVANKYFTLIIMVFSVVVSPLWSAFTDAYATHDLVWIRKVYGKMKKLWLFAVLVCVLMLLVSPYMYQLWVGEKVRISFYLSLSMALYTVAYMWHLLHIFLLNGIGALKLQMYITLLAAMLTIPVAIYLGKHLGVVGITLAYGGCFLLMGVVLSAEWWRILKNLDT